MVSPSLRSVIGITLSTLLLACNNAPQKDLPFIGNHTINKDTVNGEVVTDTLLFKVPHFEFTDQHGQAFSSHEHLKGKTHVAYFFFTSCPSICFQMTKQMKRVQDMTERLKNFEIVGFTVDPKRDNPERLLEYAHKFDAKTNKWHFLTGVADSIYHLGWNGYVVGMGKNDSAPGGFIHSERFILVDKDMHIRGMYDGTSAAEVATLVKDAERLIDSYKP